MLNGRQRYLISLLAAAVLAAWWINRQTESDRPPTPGVAHRPDYQVDALTVITMSPEGLPDRRLTALQMRHYPDDDSTELDQPLLRLYRPSGAEWTIESPRGWVGPEGDLVLLQDAVSVRREPAPGIEPLQLVTTELRVQPRAEYAETDRAVRITSGASWVEAVGLQAWFGEPGRLKLLSNVRGRYEVD